MVLVLVTGDSDFFFFFSKLKENDKRVIGCGVRSSTSDLLANNCDEFIFYDDLIRVQKRSQTRSQSRQRPKKEGGEGAEKGEGADNNEKRKLPSAARAEGAVTYSVTAFKSR